MFKLNEIPKWMEPFIGVLTDGTYKTSKELIEKTNNIKSWEEIIIVTINSRMEMLTLLKDTNLLKVEVKKPIMDVQMGEIFKVYPEQESYFTKDSNQEEDGFVMIREYMGGTGFASTWLGHADKCHSDIDVVVVPMLPMKFNK